MTTQNSSVPAPLTQENFFQSPFANGMNGSMQDVSHMPVYKFPPEVYENLPDFLKRGCEPFQLSIERDVFLMSSLGVLSCCFPNYFALYDNDKTSTNLYVMIYGVAGGGKGTMKYSRHLGAAIHEHKKLLYGQEKADYDEKMELYKSLKKDKKKSKEAEEMERPVEPQIKLMYIPANSSTSSVMEVLNANEGRGIVFASESDTLTDCWSQDWGNFSPLLRSAFHGEPVSMLRRTNKEFNEISRPWLSVVISGTPNQLRQLISEPENGLFSRFCFYELEMIPTMKNVFTSDISYDDYFKSFGEEIFNHYLKLDSSGNEIHFHFTAKQKQTFFEEGVKAHEDFFKTLGDQSIASVRRLCLINFRIAMILSMLRTMENKIIPGNIICTDTDFDNAFRITEVLKHHARKLYMSFPAVYTAPFGLKGKCLAFYQGLPPATEFDLETAMKVADALQINRKTAEGYLYHKLVSKGLVTHLDHNKFSKPSA